jgi:FPC/CPF motif-containing protein YcgG
MTATTTKYTKRGLFGADDVPTVATAFMTDFREALSRPTFPCVFALPALEHGELLFGYAAMGHEGMSAVTRLLDLCVEEIRANPDQTIILWLDDVPAESLEDDQNFSRRVLLELLAADGHWPQTEPVDPADPHWNFWYRGIDLFINFSTPRHVKRKSRNLGAAFTLVLQSRSTFDGIPPKARERVRNRICEHDALPVSPWLGEHGNAPELPQFFLGETNDAPFLLLTSEDFAPEVS